MISITNRDTNPQVLVKGDYSLSISPFDNYQLFTIYKDDNSGIPVDLNSVGTLYLNFIDDSSEVIIEEVAAVGNADKTRGEVLFKISKNDARKILAMSTSDFYISSKFTNNSSTSDETVLFSGRFGDYSADAKTSMSHQLLNLKQQVQTLTAANSTLSIRNESLSTQNIELSNEVINLKATLASMQAELSKYSSTSVISAVELNDYLNSLSIKGKGTKYTVAQLQQMSKAQQANKTTSVIETK